MTRMVDGLEVRRYEFKYRSIPLAGIGTSRD